MKKKKKIDFDTILWVDSRESRATKLWISRLIGEAWCHVMKLDCGDFMVMDGCDPSHTCGVERKTVTDFLGSLSDGRISSQIARMVATYTHPILLIESGPFKMSRPGDLVQKGRRERAEIITTSGGKIMQGKVETGWGHAAVQMLLLSLQRTHPALALVYTGGQTETGDLLRVLHQRGREGCFNGQANPNETGSVPGTSDGDDPERAGDE